MNIHTITNAQILFVIIGAVSLLSIFGGCSSTPIRTIENEDTRGPIMISSITPPYEGDAARQGVEGTVLVKMWVDTVGTVTTAMIQKSPSPLLDSAAFTAAIATKFRPALFDGKPKGVWFIAPFYVGK